MSADQNPFAPPSDELTASPIEGELRPIEIRFEIREEEVVRYQRRWLARSPILFVPLALVVIYAAITLSRGSSGADLSFVPSLVAAVVILGWLFLAAPRKRFRKLRPEQRNLVVRLGPAQIEIANAESSTKLAWALIPRFEALPDAVLVYLSAGSFHILPRRAFADEAEFQSARAWLTLKVKPASRLRSGAWKAILLWAVVILMFIGIYQFMGMKR
jgi:hypothetical protein